MLRVISLLMYQGASGSSVVKSGVFADVLFWFRLFFIVKSGIRYDDVKVLISVKRLDMGSVLR